MTRMDKQFLTLLAWTLAVFAALSVPIGSEVATDSFAYTDKIVHLLLFGVFAWLVAAFIRDSRPEASARRTLSITVALGLAYAGLGEVWQTYLEYRTTSEPDFLAGVAGVGLACLFIYVRAYKPKN